MGDYNAEKNPNVQQAQILIRNFDFIPLELIRTDEWNLDSANRVSSFHDGTRKFQCHIKYDPHAFPT